MPALPPPPNSVQTARERLRLALASGPCTVRELSQATGLAEKDVLQHLPHLKKSLRAKGGDLCILPASCLRCNFVFQKRDRLGRPGKCPACRSTHLSEPRFFIK
ncbi:MAG: ArsR family transcriptional regulator [Deltaproteobacteria bacterium]|nr:ArsR family transcriptional regulator [Deltaproteobacteria bacterium]MBW2503087.1 ArsR family transcriptional regulator [Deltaproteobacteria bacterium]MBW2519847.1 ArsR family transcriptional regulator [Deltaproteobacteria bacterium]